MELSLLAGYDDLRRCDDILTDGTAETGKPFDLNEHSITMMRIK